MVKDRLSRWFMRNVLKPRMEEMDVPGYVTTSVGDIEQLREIFLPEEIFIRLENEIEEANGKKGQKTLYEAGKEFGWRYSNISNFTKLSETSNSKFRKFFEFFIKYIESTYASKIDYELDIENREFLMEASDYQVCRENGKGYILTEGAVAGVIAYIFSNRDIEGAHIECQGRGSDKCRIECSSGIDRESDFDPQEFDRRKYRKINRVREPEFSTSSMQDLLNSGFFEFSEGKLRFESERYILMESSLMYIIEKQLKELEGCTETAQRVSKSVGREISEGRSEEFLSDYLPALGFGDVRIFSGKEKIYFRNFPWTQYSKETDLVIFRGFVTGLMEGIENEEIEYKMEKEKSADGFNLAFQRM